jgi:hypothetical protein
VHSIEQKFASFRASSPSILPDHFSIAGGHSTILFLLPGNQGRLMQNPTRYGKPPFRVAVIHGGPGAGGEMAPVASELSRSQGILEPLQTALSLPEQVEELKSIWLSDPRVE